MKLKEDEAKEYWSSRKVLVTEEPVHLAQKLNVETDGLHEQIDVGESLGRHYLRKSFSMRYGAMNAILDGQNEALLLLWGG
jgi:hypothetical protein